MAAGVQFILTGAEAGRLPDAARFIGLCRTDGLVTGRWGRSGPAAAEQGPAPFGRFGYHGAVLLFLHHCRLSDRLKSRRYLTEVNLHLRDGRMAIAQACKLFPNKRLFYRPVPASLRAGIRAGNLPAPARRPETDAPATVHPRDVPAR